LEITIRANEKEERRKYEWERKILDVLFDVVMGKVKLVRKGNEESDVFDLHRKIGGADYIWFSDFFRALRGLEAMYLRCRSKTAISELIHNLIYKAPFETWHNYHDRRLNLDECRRTP